MTVCSCESRATDATKTFTGESGLTGSIVQAWAAITGILLREKQKKIRRFIGKLLLPLEYRDFHLQDCFFTNFNRAISRSCMTGITSIAR